MKISIYGTSYVGLVTGVCFANSGHNVICYDIDHDKIKKLKEGHTIIYEPDFDNMFKAAIQNKTIEFTDNLNEVLRSNIHMICVGTPAANDGMSNLTYLFHALKNLALHINEPFILIIKSTVPPGTAEQVKIIIEEILAERKKNISFQVVSCPEFLTQGTAVHNFLHPDRVVIGTDDDSAFETVRQLYAPITAPSDKSNIPVIRMSNTSAELTKYAANLFLATKISFMNEISRIAEFTKADIIDVIHGITTDTRIGAAMSNPGCGFGGSCLQKDLKALINQSEKFTYSPNLLKSVLNVNENQKKYFIQKVFDLSGGILKNKIIAVWGISFKRNTDDLRDSVSCDLIEVLLKANAIVQAFDPVAGENAQAKFKEYPNFKICSTKEQALEDAYLLVVMTEWPHFHDIDIDLMKRTMKNLLVIDGRNIYDPNVLTKHGISYFAIGKGFLPGD